MATNYPISIDDTTTMPVVTDNVTIVTASHHNNQSDALQAVETKLGTGASTATDGKFLVGNTTAGSSQWRTIASTDIPDISGTYAPASKGVTNGDSHDHSGGDGGQIAYSSLSGTPTIPTKATGAEINTGTDDAKFATSKAIEDSNLARTTDKLSAFANTTSAELANVISDETGSGKLVFGTSPTLVTPTLGVATATSLNKVTLTAPATSATLTIAEGKTFTASNTVTLTATDGSTLAIGTGGTLGTAAYTASTNYATAAQGTTADNAVPKSLYDANSILYATTDNTPVALTVGASTIVGRKSSGDIVALTATETRTILNVADGATANTKATGAEVDTGTDDTKFVTPKAMTDSSYVKSTDNIATASNIADNTGTTTTVLHGNAAGSPAFGAVVEADITLADNTTNNVSTTKHGFAPKLSNNAGQFLDGTGSWSAPAGGGDVLGPATNTDNYLPQWNGANSKTLKDGVAIPTGGLAGLTSPVFTTPQINDTTADHQYITAVSELTADRTVTLPLLTGNDEFVFKDHTQTLANKTLTAPALNGAITGDAIATGATINTGTDNDDIVTSKAIKDANILTQTWTTYTPSTANITKGSGTLVGAYTRLGKTVWFRIKFILAADSAVGTAPTFSLPVTASSASTGNNSSLKSSYTDAGTAIYQGFVEFASNTTVKPWAINTAGTYAVYAGITASVPFTWTTNDVIEITGLYEAA